jgi:excisionase family DNA binding protein
MDNQKDFLSIKEFAEKVQMHPSSIRRAIKRGKLNAFRVGDGQRAVYRIPSSEIHRLAFTHYEEVQQKLIDKKSMNWL